MHAAFHAGVQNRRVRTKPGQLHRGLETALEPVTPHHVKGSALGYSLNDCGD